MTADTNLTTNPGVNLESSTDSGFKWNEIYSSIAQRIAEDGQNKDDGFIEQTLQILKANEELPPTFQDDSTSIRKDVDPFSFFALLNFDEGKRVKILKILKEHASSLGLGTLEIPHKFHGIPSIRHPAVFFNTENSNRKEYLWELFKIAVECSKGHYADGFEKAFDNVKQLYGSHWFTTTSVLFEMSSNSFLPLDLNTRTFLLGFEKKNPETFEKELLPVLNGKAPSAAQYLAILEYVGNKLDRENASGNPKESIFKGIRTFAQLSHKAWRSSSFAQAFELLESNHQIILTGAPGTGKTYTAKQVARAFVDENESFARFTKLIPGFDEAEDKNAALSKFFSPIHELNGESDFVENLPDYDPEKWQEKLFTARVQFHPAYDYSDFAIGMKPVLVDGGNGKKQVSFEWRDGIFKAFADRARIVYDAWCATPGNAPKDAPKFVFIIDEINRADLSRVFGELFSLLEEGYRYRKAVGANVEDDDDENSIVLPSGESFVIPENLYILGTMNDIDRSVESIDFALRRRFAWLEVTAKQSESILDAWAEKENVDSAIVEKLKSAMEALNKEIRENKDLKLGSEYELGGAYFKKFGDGETKNRKESYERLWDNHLKIILSEYLRGEKDKCDLLEALHCVYLDACGFKAGNSSEE